MDEERWRQALADLDVALDELGETLDRINEDSGEDQEAS